MTISNFAYHTESYQQCSVSLSLFNCKMQLQLQLQLANCKCSDLSDGVGAGGAGASVGLQGLCIPLGGGLTPRLIRPVLCDWLHTHTHTHTYIQTLSSTQYHPACLFTLTKLQGTIVAHANGSCAELF